MEPVLPVGASERPGQPKELSDKLDADRGYDATRRLLAWPGIGPRIARRKAEHGSGLGGKVRWVVGRTVSRLKGPRVLTRGEVMRDGLVPVGIVAGVNANMVLTP